MRYTSRVCGHWSGRSGGWRLRPQECALYVTGLRTQAWASRDRAGGGTASDGRARRVGKAFSRGILHYPRCVDNLPDHHGYRISDADRERVAEVLRKAAGDGRLDIEELEERLESAYAAKTYGELVPITQDLPVAGASHLMSVTEPVPSQAPVGGVPTTSNAIAIFGGAERKGAWVVPHQFNAFAMFGGIELDLRQATLEARDVTITAVAIMGGVDIVVPDDLTVMVDGAGILGGFADSTKRSTPAPPPGAPVVRVKGMALFGGVSVSRKPRRGGPSRNILPPVS